MLANELIRVLQLEAQTDIYERSQVELAILYAEHFQHKPKGFYKTHQIPPKTEQAIKLIVKNMTKSIIEDSVWIKAESLLRFNL